jgi:hypothetical protein
MTVATEFYNWQRSRLDSTRAPWNTCAPALVAIETYLVAKWGGKRLGCHQERDIIGGGSLSSHAFGAALDWRYSDPGVGRREMLNTVLPFLINNSKELGIQAIHDYVGCRIWRANRSSDSDGGWKDQPKSGQMGQEWAVWLHIEVNKSQWSDGRSVEDKIGDVKPLPIPPFRPERGEFGLYPLNPNKDTIKLNASGDLVKYLQGVLRKNRYQIAVDGGFGQQTRDRVMRFQRANGLLADGVVGSKTWAKIDQASK